MKVTCETVAELLENLQHELKAGSSVYRNIVYCNVDENSLSSDLVRDSLRTETVFRCSCVIEVGDEEQYLLEVSEHCGINFKDQEPELNGIERAEELKNQVIELCQTSGLTVMPGFVSI